MQDILAQLHMHELWTQTLKSDLIWSLTAAHQSWLKHLGMSVLSPVLLTGAVRLQIAHSLCIPYFACHFWKVEMGRRVAPRKIAQGSVSTTSWQCPQTGTHQGLFLVPPQTHQTPTPWRWGHLVANSAQNTLQYKHPATLQQAEAGGFFSDKEAEIKQIISWTETKRQARFLKCIFCWATLSASEWWTIS